MKILIMDKVYTNNSKLFINSLIINSKMEENLESPKINFFIRKSKSVKYDYYLIVINNLNNFPEELLNSENKSKIIIITENIRITHILKCIDITSNILYTKSSIKTLLMKIYSICKQSEKINLNIN